MAEFWSNNDRGYRIRLWIDQTSQNIAGNSSQVRVRLALLNTTTTFSKYSCSAYVDLNGQRLSWSGSPSMLSYNQTIMLIDQTITVGHNADGTKSFGFTASFSGSGGWSPGTLSIVGNSFTLTTIPRSSSVSVSPGTIGNALTININRQSSSFKHTVRYAWGNKSGTIASNVDTSTTWTIPLDFANDIPNSTSGVGTIYVDTYSGTTKIGTSSSTLSLSVPSSTVPTIDTKTVEETVDGLNTQFGTYVQNKSKIKATMTASGTYGSTIKSYKITANGETFNSDSGTTGELKTSGTNRVDFEVTDSRGRKATSYIDISVTAYENPKILSVSAIRTNDDGTANDEGTHAKITFNASVAPVGNKNTKAFIVKYKKTGSPTWAEVDVTSETYSVNTCTIVAGFDADYAYDIQLYVADYFTSITFSPMPLPTGFTITNYHPDGKGVAFGEVSDGFGFSVNLNAQFKKSVDIAGNVDASDMFIAGKALRDIFYPVGVIYKSTVNTDPSSFIGGTWERFGNGRVLVGVDEADSDFSTPNKTGGEKTHTLTIAEMPSHSHGQVVTANNTGSAIRRDHDSDGSAGIFSQGVQTEATGGGQGHNNLQPYITVYMWRRTD